MVLIRIIHIYTRALFLSLSLLLTKLDINKPATKITDSVSTFYSDVPTSISAKNKNQIISIRQIHAGKACDLCDQR